ncbi:MAG TPA: EAL domain-containing protein, partial [Devosia sp.]
MLRHLRPFSPTTRDTAEASKIELAEQATRLVRAFEEHGVGWFWETDAEGKLTYISAPVERALSVAGIQAIGASFIDLFLLDTEGAAISRTLSFHLAKHSGFKNYPVRSARQPEGAWWSISGEPRFDDKGSFCGFVGSGTDLTEKRRSQAAITKLAYSDGLTGLANRERMRGTLEHLLTTRQSGFHPTALFLLDLDRFKAVNDTLGHQVGDELLKQVALRLQRLIGSGGEVGRLGGDEFQIIVAHDGVRGEVDQIASGVVHAVSQPYFIANQPITIGCSIGIAIAPEHGQSVQNLVRNADLALYAAKDAGRGQHCQFADALLVEARRRKELEDDLREALANGELRVAYQPVVATRTSTIVGFEALVRWTHPKRGQISPSEFIPVAEECGIIGAIGEWVLRTAVADAARWAPGVRVAVNVSPKQFSNVQFPQVVMSALASAGLAAEQLELEITESVFLSGDEHSDRMFKALKAIGVRLALDDFGTGYSSLGYLKNAPFDKIKIDQSFVRGAINSGSRNAAIIKAIVTLADTLGMETTAEGVEQQDEIEFIRDLGCSHIQGYVYGKPMPFEDAVRLLDVDNRSARPIGYKMSRAPREKVIRSARLCINEEVQQVVVKNVSPHGAMIEGPSIRQSAMGLDVLIELLEGQVWQANVRWAEEGRMGLLLNRQLG